MTPYKLQLVQHLKDSDKPLRRDFCIAMQQKMENDGFDDLFLAMRRLST